MHETRFGEADLSDCDREPIRVPGSIQPYGVLLSLDPVTLQVLQIGGDTQRVLGLTREALIEHGIGAELGPAALLRLKDLIERDLILPRPFFVIEVEVQGQAFDICAHLSGGLIVLELEKRRANAPEEAIALVQTMMSSVQAADGIDGLLQAITGSVQATTGFDRVMLYKFQEDDSGHVVAETRSGPTIDSFLDLHYPADDIPVQARALYCSCWIRYIPDARYIPAPLVPVENPRTGEPLDLSLSLLRSVSPVHLEYLANMGVKASMSLSIVIDGKLWGLVACHHHETLYLSCRIRAAIELFAQLASLQIKTRIELDLSIHRVKARDIMAQLVETMTANDLESLLRQQPNLLDLINAGGVAVIVDGAVSTLGSTPEMKEITALSGWLNEEQTEGIIATDRLALRYPPAETFLESGAGLLSLSISRVPRDYVLWFLPEVETTVVWGGKPDKVIVPGPLGSRLTPRKSFEAWSETVRGASRPWEPEEMDAAGALRVAILETVLKRIDMLGRERDRARAHQDFLMAELDHRVKNTLATIQAVVRSSSRSAVDLISYTHSLERRLHAMAKAHSLLTRSRWEGASLRDLVCDELSSHRPAGHPMVSVEGDDLDLEPKAAVAISLVLHELATNAAKYGSLSLDTGRVAVGWSRQALEGRDWLAVSWTEQGGPPVVPPTRIGFGRTLLEKAFAYDVDGRVHLDFRPDGVVCDLWIPYACVVDRDGEHAPAAPLTIPRPVLQGLTVLLAEDNAMVALEVADLLRDAGATVLGPFARVADAAGPAQHAAFDLALLDIDLHGEAVWPVAEIIAKRDIPFAFATGYTDSLLRPPLFRNAATIHKPYDVDALVGTLAGLLARRG